MELINGDCIAILSNMDDNSIDMIFTDPPYKVYTGGNKVKNAPKGILKNNSQLMEDIPEFNLWLDQCYRVLKDSSHAYFMVNFLNLEKLLEAVRKSGFEVHNLLVWNKNTMTPNRWYMKNVEYVIFARKGKAKAINNKGSKTSHNFDNTRNRIHPTQKPIELIEFYIENSSNIGDLILDPFAGSMSTVISCLNLNRDCIAIEINEKHFKSGNEAVQKYMNEF